MSGKPMTFVGASNVAPAANAVQADTGQLSAGNYEFVVNLSASDTVAVGKGLIVEHRNAANNATVVVLGAVAPSGAVALHIPRITLAANERVRVIVGTVSGAASSRYVSSIGRRMF
jgi:hypothetical protein